MELLGKRYKINKDQMKRFAIASFVTITILAFFTGVVLKTVFSLGGY